MKMKAPFLYRFCHKVFYILAAFTVFLMIFYNSFIFTEVSYNGFEKVNYKFTLFPLFLTVVASAVIILTVSLLKDILKKTDMKKLFVFLTLCYAVCALYLIFNSGNNIRADAFYTYQSAYNYSNGNYSDFAKEGYMHRFPHQLGLMLYDRILMSFSPNPQLNFFVNFIFVIGINFFSYKISDIIFEDKYVNAVTVIMSFAFLPQLFFILFAYGLIPGLFFTAAAFYFTLLYVKNRKVLHLVLLSFCIGAAVLLKNNYLIAAAAIIIYLLLTALKDKKAVCLIAVVAIFIFVFFPGKILLSYYEYKTDSDLHNPTPAVLWIGMGTDIENVVCGPGWFDNYVFKAYEKADFNTEKAEAAGIEKISENIDKIKNDPHRAAAFFNTKIFTQWTDPLYESVWTGPLAHCRQYTYTDFMQSLYSGGRAENGIGMFCKILTLIIWIFSAVFLLKYSKKYNGWEIMFLYCLGGFIFHIFWEAKSQYIYPYIYCLIPFSAYAFTLCCRSFSRRLQQRNDKRRKL